MKDIWSRCQLTRCRVTTYPETGQVGTRWAKLQNCRYLCLPCKQVKIFWIIKDHWHMLSCDVTYQIIQLVFKFPIKAYCQGCQPALVSPWFISLMTASPIILLGLLDIENVLLDNQCAIFNPYFLIYGSLAAFVIPQLIMLIAYTLTIRLLIIQAKKCGAGEVGCIGQ